MIRELMMMMMESEKRCESDAKSDAKAIFIDMSICSTGRCDFLKKEKKNKKKERKKKEKRKKKQRVLDDEEVLYCTPYVIMAYTQTNKKKVHI